MKIRTVLLSGMLEPEEVKIERQKLKRSIWRKKNSLKIRAYDKAYREKNRGKLRLYYRSYSKIPERRAYLNKKQRQYRQCAS